MTFLALSVAWLGEVVAGLLFFEAFLLVARAFVAYFYGRDSPIAYALMASTEPVAGPFRTVTRRLGLRFDLAPILAALVLYVVQAGVLFGAGALAIALDRDAFLLDGAPAGLVAIRWLIWTAMFVVIVRVSISWFGAPQYHPFARKLRRLVDPALDAIRRVLGSRRGGFDLAPLVLLSMLWFLERVLLQTLIVMWIRKGGSR